MGPCLRLPKTDDKEVETPSGIEREPSYRQALVLTFQGILKGGVPIWNPDLKTRGGGETHVRCVGRETHNLVTKVQGPNSLPPFFHSHGDLERVGDGDGDGDGRW